MLEKNTPMPQIDQIEFNWERVKKKAASRREELVTNAPNIIKRPIVNTRSSIDIDPIPNTNTPHIQASQPDPSHDTLSHTTPKRPPVGTNDTLYDPSYSIDRSIKDMGMTSDSHTPPVLPSDSPTSKLLPSDSHTPSVLPRTSPHEVTSEGDTSIALTSNELLGPDKNAVELLRSLKNKETTGRDLTMDERRLVVRSMKELGSTQDSIADLLEVSRRTVVADYKVLRTEQALVIAKTDTEEIAGEVYDVAKTCIRRALAAGSFKTVSVIMRDMVEVLQSLGVLYRAPKTSMQAQLHGSIPGSNKGYNRYMEGIGEDKNKVVELLDCMFNAIDKGQINEAP
jgi:predicted transcriptional regulator